MSFSAPSLPRRVRIVSICAVLTVLAACQVMASPIVLQNDKVSLELDRDTGVITKIVDKQTSLTLAAPPGLAESFRITVRLPERQVRLIRGCEQKLSTVEERPNSLTLRWNGPLRDTTGAEYDIPVEMQVEADGSRLEFRLSLLNNTLYKIQEIFYPVVGGLSHFAEPGGAHDATLWGPTSTPTVNEISLPLKTETLTYPGQLAMSFINVRNNRLNRSLYISARDTVARWKVYRFLTLGDDAKGKDIGFCMQHTPFTRPGERYVGSPLALRFIDGDWHNAGKIYREWFASTFGIADPEKCWIRKQSFFLMTMFMLPEGTINYTFKDIPKWGKSAKDHGVNAVMISGWNMGGHDNGYPYYIIDPRLGTWDELREGIRKCHEMGLKVYFFANYQPMMVETDWYKNDLKRYLEQNEDGSPTWLAGWGMGTLPARMGHAKLMSWADLSFPEFRRMIARQFAKLAQIGADGVHIDKMFPAGYDFNPLITASADTATWEGAIALTRQIMSECKRYNPDWAMSFECNWDRMLEFTDATWWVGNQSITRYVFPEHVETLLLASAYDYIGVNNAVRQRHTVQVAPMNFCRSMDWKPFQGLANYIKAVKGIQDSLMDTVYMGEVLDHQQVTLAEPLASGVEYNVYRNRRTGKRACILTNSGMDAMKQQILSFDGNASGKVRIHAPFRKTRTVRLPAQIEVPGERIVFVEEL